MHLPSPSAVPSDGGQPPARRRTLLIVDDEEGPRQSLRIVFKDEYNVLLAENGPRALELLRHHAVDAAVLDIRMAGMSGTELLGKIKQIDPAVEVVMLTAYETIDTMRQSLRHGACDYLTKPFDVSTMRSAVARAMQRRALADRMRANENELRSLKDEIERERMTAEMARQKGEIYASVIHDLNNPLTIIAGVIDLINSEMARLYDPGNESLAAVQEHLEQISRQVASCSQISRRYLGFLRQRNAGETRVSANQVLSDLRTLLKSHRSWQDNELEVGRLEADVDVRINGTDLIQILLNLVTNAFQAGAAPHKVKVLAEPVDDPLPCLPAPGPKDVVLPAEDAAAYRPFIRFTVSDDGPGMQPEVLVRVFEPYFTTRAAGGGSGLGLAIVQRLVKGAHGAIHLHSEAGKGTTFSIYLPAAAAPARGRIQFG